MPEADKARREFIPKMIPPASLAYVEKAARCILPGPLEADDRHPYQIIQRPGYFVMMYEYNHVTRVIPTDGRPHVGPNIRLFMGDSVGHWEGETLVVDTTNFNDKTSLGRTVPYHSDALHTIERFTRIDPNILDYQITIDDPKMFTRPIKIAGTFQAADAGHRADGVCVRRRQPGAPECIRVRVRARPRAGQPVTDLNDEAGDRPMKTTLCVLAAFAALLAIDRPAVAHHSFAAEFDANQPVTVNGAVSKMDWVNPHSWIYVDVKEAGWQGRHLAIRNGSPQRPAAHGLEEGFDPAGHAGQNRRLPREIRTARGERQDGHASRWPRAVLRRFDAARAQRGGGTGSQAVRRLEESCNVCDTEP